MPIYKCIACEKMEMLVTAASGMKAVTLGKKRLENLEEATSVMGSLDSSTYPGYCFYCPSSHVGSGVIGTLENYVI